jgi:hypothetical protein|tara:strand:+ start:298 stop:717 length:420 start_codon:yes stop_codon:yes gene_type:complete
MSEKKPIVKYEKYQQGDVVMYKINDSKYFDKYTNYDNSHEVKTYSGNSSDKAILAFGEVTGHTHRIDMSELLSEAGVTLHMDYNGVAGKDVPKSFQVHGTKVHLQHEEHDTITLPPGNYVVKIVREFNHITRRAQYVAD